MKSKDESEKLKTDELNYYFHLKVLSSIVTGICIGGIIAGILANSSFMALVCAVIIMISIATMSAPDTAVDTKDKYVSTGPYFFSGFIMRVNANDLAADSMASSVDNTTVSDTDQDLYSNQAPPMASSMV